MEARLRELIAELSQTIPDQDSTILDWTNGAVPICIVACLHLQRTIEARDTPALTIINLDRKRLGV